jgi:hypothetical protein
MEEQRKRKLREALDEVQRQNPRIRIYCVGLVAILRDDQYDSRVTLDEVREILEEQGFLKPGAFRRKRELSYLVNSTPFTGVKLDESLERAKWTREEKQG